jgi:cysteine synthase B
MASLVRTRGSEAASPADVIGNTPLVRLHRFETKPGVELHAKLESRNPGGSVKDRAALGIILEAERSGALHRGRILLDATSGNTGISYAMIGASRGYRVRLCVPANVTPERKRILQAYGAELILTNSAESSDGAIREARRLYAEQPDRYFYADQYGNPANWRAHYQTTAVEIFEQTEGRVTHFVAGLGTSGTFIGTGRRLRELLPSIRLVSVQPESPLHGLEGLKHMASAIVPTIYDPGLADADERVSTEEAYALVRRLAREEGILAGPSAGAALSASLRVARSIDRGVIVTVFPDGGDRYLSAPFWDEPDHAVEIAGAALERIRAHAAAAYPEECCGALIGAGGRVVHAVPLDNESPDTRARRFLVGPVEYRIAEARAKEADGELLGFYHSHPDHPAVPSGFDLEHAWPNFSYVIVSARREGPGDTRSWRLREDRSGYDEETIVERG